jgi:eukaryotic-like serine/threonine-protein kinase
MGAVFMTESTRNLNTDIGTLPASLAPARPSSSSGAAKRSAALSATPVRDEYVDWVLLGQGPDGLAYSAKRERDGVSVELRVIRPIAGDQELREALQRRLRLLSLCTTALVRHVVDSRLSDTLPIIVLERPLDTAKGEASLQVAIDESQKFDRLAVARELIAVLRATHRLGLYLGTLDPSTIILGSEGRIRVDVTATQCFQGESSSLYQWPFAEACVRGEQDDLVDLKRVLERLFDNDSADLSSLPARSRAALRSMLRTPLTNQSTLPTLTQWEALIGVGRVEPLPDDPHGTMESGPELAAQIVAPNGSESELPPASDQTVILVGTESPQQRPADAPQESAEAALDATHVAPIGEVISFNPQESEVTGEMQLTPTPSGAVHARDSSTKQRPTLEPGTMIGRYRLEEKLGQGGMGVVFRATDLCDNTQVAIKILWSNGMDSMQAIRRFQKEARLLAGVQNDFVTRLHEVGEDNGLYFLAMEYVQGTTLKHWLAASGPIDEKSALMLISDIARGLLEAHAKGIVHRDIKPENVLLQTLDPNSNALLTKRVKLSDFGIARQVEQSVSMEVTQAGALLGTPRYMSPEQCRGSKEIGPQADVYSLGITLYELLTGSPPFSGADALQLAAMHCFEPVPSIQKKVPAVSDLTSQIIQQALAKDPNDRFADAAQLLASVQRILRGEARDFEMHPRLPTHDTSKLWEKTFTWDLESSPDQLWPLVSNTERLNRAIGLPPVTYRTENDPKLGLRKFGSFKLAGVSVSWEEHPFEWVEGSRMGILREFDAGPFKWFMSVVELVSRPDGGTQLNHKIRIERRNWVGRVMTTLEADWRGGKNLDRVYRRIDQSIQKKLQSVTGTDAFEPTTQPKKHQKDRIEQRGEKLLARGLDPDLVNKLVDFIATAPAQVIAQIRPLPLAAQLGVDSEQCLTACLCAAADGLLLLRWEILCPTCRVSASAESILSSIKDHTHCVACDYDFRSDLGDAIELVFRAHPEIREVDDAIYCIGGPEHSPHVVAQVRLEAEERVELEVKLSAGDYLVRGPRLVGQQRLRVRATPAPSTHEVAISELGKTDHTPVLRAGRQIVTLTNDLDHLQVLRIERMIPRDDVVTATHASTLALFRELFPDQVLGQNRPIAADEMTLVATSIFEAEQLYDARGDREAYDLIAKHLEVLRICIASHRGTVAKTIGEGVLAAFNDCEHAVDAALAMQSALDEESELGCIRLSIGINRGRTLVATMNQRLDYFGATARAVSALPDFAAGDILMTEAVFGDPEVQSRLRKRGLTGSIESLHLPGRPNQTVQRVVIPRS